MCTVTGNTFISYKKLFLVQIEPTRVKIFIIPCKKCQFLFIPYLTMPNLCRIKQKFTGEPVKVFKNINFVMTFPNGNFFGELTILTNHFWCEFLVII
jgi:hypothetical protein